MRKSHKLAMNHKSSPIKVKSKTTSSNPYGDRLTADGELHQTQSADRAELITNQGMRISDNQNFSRAHPRGTGLPEDFILREKIKYAPDHIEQR